MSIQTQCVFFTRPHNVELQTIELPEPSPTQILVRTRKTAISTGTELTILTGDFPANSRWAEYGRYPFRAGYSNVGEVIAVGDAVDGWSVGDRIAGYGAHSQFVTYNVGAMLVHPPDEIDDDTAATIALGVIVLNGVRRANIKLGECAVVYGLGPLGQLTWQLARLNGARPVIGVDIVAERLELALRLGCDAVIDGATCDVVERVKAINSGRLADVVFEVTGNPDVIPKEMEVLREQGRIVILSSPRGPTLFDFHDLCNAPSFTIIGAHNSSHPPHPTPDNPWTMQRDGELYFELIKRGELRVADLVTHHFPWNNAPEAYELLLSQRGRTGIVILDWSDDYA